MLSCIPDGGFDFDLNMSIVTSDTCLTCLFRLWVVASALSQIHSSASMPALTQIRNLPIPFQICPCFVSDLKVNTFKVYILHQPSLVLRPINAHTVA